MFDFQRSRIEPISDYLICSFVYSNRTTTLAGGCNLNMRYLEMIDFETAHFGITGAVTLVAKGVLIDHDK